MGAHALFASAIGPAVGRPILVIGGGPSASASMSAIPRDYPACVISANAHGFKQDKFKTDFIVGVDFYFATPRAGMHIRQPMSEYVAQFPAKTINRWSWADYRLPEFVYGGDSGLTAIYVAALLGGHPVIPVGIDFMQGDRRYWWDETPEPGWELRKRVHNPDNQSAAREALVELCRHTCVRPMAGPLLQHWPAWRADEVLPEFRPIVCPQTAEIGEFYQVIDTCFLHPTDRLEAGQVVPLSAGEADHLLAKKKVTKIAL